MDSDGDTVMDLDENTSRNTSSTESDHSGRSSVEVDRPPTIRYPAWMSRLPQPETPSVERPDYGSAEAMRLLCDPNCFLYHAWEYYACIAIEDADMSDLFKLYNTALATWHGKGNVTDESILSYWQYELEDLIDWLQKRGNHPVFEYCEEEDRSLEVGETKMRFFAGDSTLKSHDLRYTWGSFRGDPTEISIVEAKIAHWGMPPDTGTGPSYRDVTNPPSYAEDGVRGTTLAAVDGVIDHDDGSYTLPEEDNEEERCFWERLFDVTPCSENCRAVDGGYE